MKIVIDDEDRIYIDCRNVELKELKKKLNNIAKIISDSDKSVDVRITPIKVGKKVVNLPFSQPIQKQTDSEKSKYQKRLTKQDVKDIIKEFNERTQNIKKGFRSKKISDIKKDLAKRYGITPQAISYYVNSKVKK